MSAVCRHYRQEIQRVGKRPPILPIKDFNEQIVEHGPQAKAADGEDDDGNGNGHDETALGTAETAGWQRPDLGIAFCFFFDQLSLCDRLFTFVILDDRGA